MTVVIAPSRSLRLVQAGFGASLLGASLAVGLLLPARYLAGPLVAAALLCAGLCVAHAACRFPVMSRIDISGLGQLRLTVQQDVGVEADHGLPVRLMPGSTLWPRMLLLRLGAATGTAGPACRCLVVLPDSVTPDAFRALTVALGGTVGPLDGSSVEYKIL